MQIESLVLLQGCRVVLPHNVPPSLQNSCSQYSFASAAAAASACAAFLGRIRDLAMASGGLLDGLIHLHAALAVAPESLVRRQPNVATRPPNNVTLLPDMTARAACVLETFPHVGQSWPFALSC